jgi:Ser/Thr protein kinase RdoA (MazF antagonist)
MFEEAPPPLPSLLDETLLLQIGAKIARLHVIADGFNTDFGIPEIQSDEFLREQVSNTSRFLSHQDRAFLGSVSEQLAHILKRLPRKAPDFGLCHADLVMSNLRLTSEGTITIFDFGNVQKTWRVFELAIVYWSLGSRYQDSRDDLWKAFIQGYESIRELPEALSEYLVVMLILRQISFLGGNCATLPLRLGTEPFESGFIENGMAQLRAFVDKAGIQTSVNWC